MVKFLYKINHVCLLVFFLGIAHFASRASQENAFILKGEFEDTFANKHNNGGTFVINTYGSNALIDVTFENGFRQMVGTDGRDSFNYYANGQAVISHGRFPQDANEIEQFLWLVCVQDSELVTNLHRYSFPFFGKYISNDITPFAIASSVSSNRITSIEWYAPNYDLIGTNRYKLAMYKDGWLLANIVVTKTNHINSFIVPSEIIFTQYKTRSVDLGQYQTNTSIGNASKYYNLPSRDARDVVPVEIIVFSITNSEITKPLSTYIPEIVDRTTRVNDKRFPEMGVVKVTSSGKWWMAHELYKEHLASVKPRRIIILILLIISSIFTIFLMFKIREKADKH